MTVAPKFRGSFDQKIDAKGRVSIPAAFRKIAEACDPDFVAASARSPDVKPNPASIVIVFGRPGRLFLECYSIIGMTEIDARIEAKDIESDERIILEDLYYANATTAEIDNDGRIVMPQFLRERLKFDGEARFVGMGDRFEIWAPETYNAVKSAPTRQMEERFGPNFNPRTLLQNKRPE